MIWTAAARKICRLLFAFVLAIALPAGSNALASDWLSAPKPPFPSDALKRGAEGSVKLRVLIAKDGHVKTSTVLKSSGDPALDAAAQKTVAKWKLKQSAIKSSDLLEGRTTIVEFKQEAIVAAVYPDRTAFFSNWTHTDMWMFAPFPAYPLHVREMHHTGTVMVKARIGPDGRVSSAEVLRSSGHADLDELAVAAVRLWRAHKRYAGQSGAFPITFVIAARRR
jgi:TonB family protein